MALQDADGDGYVDAMDNIPGLSSGGSTTDGAVVPSGTSFSDIQTAIDNNTGGSDFGQSPTTTVRLLTGTNYTGTSTITVKPNVRLECNGARLEPTSDINVVEMQRNTELREPHIDCRGVGSYSSNCIQIGNSASGKLEIVNRARVRDAFIQGPVGGGAGIVFWGGSGPCSMQRASGDIRGFDKSVYFYASGSDISSSGDWSNGNQFFGTARDSRIGVYLESEGAAVSGNIVQMEYQTGSDTEWGWRIEGDKRDPGTSPDWSDNNYVLGQNSFQMYIWDIQNVDNSYYDSGTDSNPPLGYIGRGKCYSNNWIDWNGRYGKELIVNDSDIRPRENGVLNPNAGDVRGVTSFSVGPSYTKRSGSDFHPDGNTT